MIFSVLFLFSVFPAAGYADDGIVEVPHIKVIINGKNVVFDDVIIASKGKNLLPLRVLLTNLGVQNDNEHIIWNGSEKSITIIKDSTKVKLFQDSNVAYLNDVPIELDVPPVGYSKNGRTYIPARFVAQSLGKIVKWDNSTKSIIINDPKQVIVESADELVAAMDSDTKIILKKGVYNLSKVKQEYTEKSIFWESVFDGNQLIIKGVENLTMEGEGDTPAEIVVEPRYANVFSFRDSNNITIKNIKTGHTPEQGECAGGVLVFDGGGNISILDSELYGCGINGLTLNNVNTLLFANSTIRDCNAAIMILDNSKDIRFYKSTFSDNQGYSYGIEATNNSSLSFDACDFTNNKIGAGYFFSFGLSKIAVKNSRIYNNSYPALASDPAVLTMENTKIEGNDSGEDSLNKASELYRAGKYEETLNYLDKAIAAGFDKYGAFSLKGDALYFLGRYEEAIRCYDEILAVPGKATAYIYYSKGAALYRLGKYNESILCYDEALELESDYIDALNNKGDSLSALGRYDEATASYEKVFALDPGNIEAMCGQGNIFFYQQNYKEAIKAYDDLIRLNPDYITAYTNKGVALYLMAEYEKSLVCFDKVINELSPENADAYYHRAEALAKLNRAPDAIGSLKKAIELFPEYKEYAKTNNAFDSIKNRADFKALLQ